MSTGTELIFDALAQLGVRSVQSTQSPEALAIGLRVLNSMTQLWISRNIRVGLTPIAEAGDEVGEFSDSRNAVVSNLALSLAPYFDNGKRVTSDDLRRTAASDLRYVKGLHRRLTVPQRVLSSTTPLGAGNFEHFPHHHQRLRENQ